MFAGASLPIARHDRDSGDCRPAALSVGTHMTSGPTKVSRQALVAAVGQTPISAMTARKTRTRASTHRERKAKEMVRAKARERRAKAKESEELKMKNGKKEQMSSRQMRATACGMMKMMTQIAHGP